jgi:hypothetical protein
MADPRNVAELYEWAIASYNKKPIIEVAEAWESVLHDILIPELRNALRIWQADTTEEWDGRPRGAKFPEPSDLAMIASKQKLYDRSRSSTAKFVSCGQCQDGWIHVTRGTTAGGHPVDEKIGAVLRCECWNQYLCGVFGIARSQLKEKLREREEERRGSRNSRRRAA